MPFSPVCGSLRSVAQAAWLPAARALSSKEQAACGDNATIQPPRPPLAWERPVAHGRDKRLWLFVSSPSSARRLHPVLGEEGSPGEWSPAGPRFLSSGGVGGWGLEFLPQCLFQLFF